MLHTVMIDLDDSSSISSGGCGAVSGTGVAASMRKMDLQIT